MITSHEENNGADFYAAVSAIARFIEAAGTENALPENTEKVE